MFDIVMREFKDFFVDPIISILKWIRLNPNTITLLSGFCGKLKSWSHFLFMINLRSDSCELLNSRWEGTFLSIFPPNKIIWWNWWCICSSYKSVHWVWRIPRYPSWLYGKFIPVIVKIYGLTPIGVTLAHPSNEAWLALSLMLVTFFVNSAGLFMLSALIEKNKYALVREMIIHYWI